LIFNVALWLPYGLFSTFQPTYLGEWAGVVGATPTGLTEIRAMYGGLEAGIGAICLLAVMRPEHTRTALITLFFLTGGLAIARLLGFLIDGSYSDSGYTYGALMFESVNTLLAALLLRRQDQINQE